MNKINASFRNEKGNVSGGVRNMLAAQAHDFVIESLGLESATNGTMYRVLGEDNDGRVINMVVTVTITDREVTAPKMGKKATEISIPSIFAE